MADPTPGALEHETERALDALADHVLGDGMGDPIAVAHALRGMLTAAAWADVMDRAELCPVHIRDAEICADDRTACPTGQPENN